MRAAIRAELMEILKQPRTYQELADILGVSYVSARRYIMELVRQDEAMEMPMKRDGHLQYVRRRGAVNSGVLQVALGDRLVTLPELISGMATSIPFNHRLGSLVAQLYMKQLVKGTDKQHLEGIATTIEMKADLRALAGAVRRTAKAIDQLLDYDPLWEDKRDVVMLFGDCSPIQMEAWAREFLESSNANKTGRG